MTGSATIAVPAAVSTPCVGVCALDGDLCRGCGRTLDEIAGWAGLDEAARRAVMAQLPSRLAAPALAGRSPR